MVYDGFTDLPQGGLHRELRRQDHLDLLGRVPHSKEIELFRKVVLAVSVLAALTVLSAPAFADEVSNSENGDACQKVGWET